MLMANKVILLSSRYASLCNKVVGVLVSLFVASLLTSFQYGLLTPWSRVKFATVVSSQYGLSIKWCFNSSIHQLTSCSNEGLTMCFFIFFPYARQIAAGSKAGGRGIVK
uniref:Uncharacterized protein n=1 Tax=Vibrio harveyi TaxID=669 RepID=E5G5Q2_VIBHA|nr:hypothetical protein [Vibrio harveyi]